MDLNAMSEKETTSAIAFPLLLQVWNKLRTVIIQSDVY